MMPRLHDRALRSSGTTRDLRVDFLRGVALLFIFMAHVYENPVPQFTLISWGFADTAECYFFLSGYVCALAYGRVLKRDGFAACLRKAWRRVGQIYVANIVFVVAFALMIRIWQDRSPEHGFPYNADRHDPIIAAGWAELPELLSLKLEPMVLTVLAVYMVFLLILPWVLALAQRRIALVFLLSLLVYLCVTLFPEHARMPDPWHAMWYFNPFAWQFVFFCGVAWGYAAKWREWIIPRHVIPLVAAGFVIEAAFLLRLLYPVEVAACINRSQLAPLRLLYFYCMLVVGRFVFRRDAALLRWRPIELLSLIGKRPLLVYCTGALLATFAALLIATYGPTGLLLLFINVAGCAILGVIAFGAESLSHLQKVKVATQGGAARPVESGVQDI